MSDGRNQSSIGKDAILGLTLVSIILAVMDHPTAWMLLRFVKFLGVIAYGAGVGVGLSAAERRLRKQAVHLFASPTLLVTWLAGYLLTLFRGTPLSEAWIVGGFSASLVCHLLLIRTTRAKSISARQRAGVLSPLVLTVLLMVFRPTWWSV